MDKNRRPSDDLWHRTLSHIATTFGRLNYLAERRNADTGRYLHEGLVLMFGDEAANAALRDSHIEVFRAWLNMNLEEQQADLLLFWSGLPADRNTLIQNWTLLRPYTSVMPATASNADKALFIKDLDLLLKILKRDAASARNPSGSQRR